MRKYVLIQILLFVFISVWANEIDNFFPAAELKTGILCSDEVFIRRTYLTLTGRLPQVEQVKAFLASKYELKRSELINQILDSEEYIRYMQMRWGDILRIKSELPSNLWPNGVQAYNRWLYEKLASNTPYNNIVKELLLSKGSNFKSPAVNFYRAFLKKTPENIYENIDLLFLGNRTQSDDGAKCFSQIQYKKTKEWKEEIVFVDIHKNFYSTSVTMPDKKVIQLNKGEDWRVGYVDWLTNKSNKRFSAVMANRLWYWIFGQGIVNEPDDWGAHNPPSNPKLMDYLANQFVVLNYDMKAFSSLILNSKTYQSLSTPTSNFVPQRLQAEIIVDALADITGISDAYRSRVPEPFSFFPMGTRSVDLGDATVSSSTLELFGRVSRDVSLESQRSNKLTSKQLLYLMNSSELEERLRKSVKLNLICQNQKNIAGVCDEITLLILSRYASNEEKLLFKEFSVNNKVNLRDLATTIAWTQINSTEFLYNH